MTTTSLDYERAKRANDADGVDPVNMLKDALARYERGDFDAPKALLVLVNEDGTPAISLNAGLDSYNLIAVLNYLCMSAFQRMGWLK